MFLISASQVLEVVRYFRNKHAAVAALENAELTKPPMPTETRWTTLHQTLRYYQQNCGKLQDIVAIIPIKGPKKSNRPRVITSIQNILEDATIRRTVESILSILDPICHALNTLQSDSANLAEAYSQFMKLEKVFLSNNLYVN